MSEYKERDIIEQGEHYARHVNAMTAEGLHSKSDIAAELAHRDIENQQLQAANKQLLETLERVGDDVLFHELGVVTRDMVIEAITNARQVMGDSNEKL